jgi:hypothetical protein
VDVEGFEPTMEHGALRIKSPVRSAYYGNTSIQKQTSGLMEDVTGFEPARSHYTRRIKSPLDHQLSNTSINNPEGCIGKSGLMEDVVGLEPTTSKLKVSISTD